MKIKREEEQIKNKKLRYNLSGIKKMDNHFSFTKTVIDEDNKEIAQLKKKYEILKLINSEYNEYLKEFKYNNNFQRTFTPQEFNMLTKKSFSYSIIESIPKNVVTNGNSPSKKGYNYKKNTKRTNKNNSVSSF